MQHRKQFPSIRGLQPTFLEQGNQFDVMQSGGVQILNEHKQSLGVCVKCILAICTLNIYDKELIPHHKAVLFSSAITSGEHYSASYTYTESEWARLIVDYLQ